jgi:endonuclease/exonuclease/phosphatase family metal-dependent hydrolase
LKVLTWNIHHPIGTDGVYNITRIADWIVKTGANVVSLNEVEEYVGGYGNEDQPARFASMLKSKTGKTLVLQLRAPDRRDQAPGQPGAVDLPD